MHVSTSSSSRDELNCLLHPEELVCSTLHFAITSILLRQMSWISTIYIDKYTNSKPEIIILPKTSATSSTKINIACFEPCIITSDLTILSGSFNGRIILQVQNISFSNSKIAVGNVHMIFRNVQFEDSVIIDQKITHDFFGQINLYFADTKFETHRNGNTTAGLYLTKTFGAAIQFTESELTNASIQVNVPHLLFVVNNTHLANTQVILFVNMFCLSLFQGIFFTGVYPYSPHNFMLSVASNQLNLTAINCTVQNSKGFLKITKRKSGVLVSWMKVHFENSLFLNSRKQSSGGALEINYFASNAHDQKFSNFVKIRGCTFTQNKADRLGLTTSEGGGLSVVSQTTSEHCEILNVSVDKSVFTDNQASDGGGAIFVSGGCLSITVLKAILW